MTQAREATGREAGATAGAIDDRSVKPTEAAMTRARRSRAASAISSPIRVACRSRSWCMRPTFGTAPGHRVCSPRRRYPIRGRATSLLRAVMAEGSCAARSTRPASGPSRNHRALRYGQGGRVVAPPPGGGAYLRPAGTLPPSGKGCRGNRQKRRCPDYHRQHPPHDQPVGKNLISAQPS